MRRRFINEPAPVGEQSARVVGEDDIGPLFELEPAFPVYTGNEKHWQFGMSLLDYFAAKAMQAEIASCVTEESAYYLVNAAKAQGRNIEQQIASNAYDVAEAMIAERNRRNGN